MPQRPSTPSMSDVARRAGVSRGTVSNVLNAPHVVRPQVRERVLAAIAQLGYVRNESARTLAAGSSRVIGIVLADLGNSLFVDLARGAEELGAAHGMKVVIVDSAIDAERQREALALFRELRAAGVILTPLNPVDETLKAPPGGAPLVLADHTHPHWDGSSVTTDERLGGLLATRHLLQLGRRRLLFAGCTGNVKVIDERHAGAAAAVAEIPGATLTTLTAEGLEIASGRDIARQALQVRKPFDAIFAATDLMAVGCIQVLRSAGVRVPEDVAVVGFDDNRFASEDAIPISTIAKNAHRVGEEAMRLVLDALYEADTAPRQVVLEPELVARQSSLGSAVQAL
ncbi:LacI family DNA-binding transcriptional regulator [Streptomyces sp. NPDC090106]|uniref:LacI family DNA-binding transcriptional regulator n=1 Tax=Streptomyces sp. NPDC090106 TaxID=3365946 RepID=UPI0038161BE4